MSSDEKSSSLLALLKLLQKIPSLSSKNLYRVADYFLSADEAYVKQFCLQLHNLCRAIERCDLCFVWKERGVSCDFCASDKRNKNIICVVERWQDLLVIEKTNGYTGLYHILGGAINPLEGIHPCDLSIDILLRRLQDFTGELLIATNQTPAGEATAAYIVRKLDKQRLFVVSGLARGLPVGASLEGMDHITLLKAISERRFL